MSGAVASRRSAGRRRRRPLLAALLAGALLAPAAPAAAREVPFLSGRVVDEAGLLSAEARQRLEPRLAALERETGAQLAVLVVSDLGGDPIEDFSLRVVEEWELGGAERDDGLLFLVAVEERRMRVDVGYGLEDDVPDILAGRILDGLVQPRFRRGDFDGGVEAGVEALAELARGNEEAVAQALPRERRRRSGWGTVIFVLGVILLLHFLQRRGGGARVRRGGAGTPWIFPGGGGGRGGGFGGGGFSGGGGSFGGGGASSSW